MPYVGNQPSGNFVQVTSQTITGNGGATYTLDRPAGNSAEIEVFVNHVRQDPASYTVSGTSLQLGGNITSSDSCYVVFQAAAVGTATHPATANLQAADGTFSGAVSGTTGTFTGDLTVDTNTLHVNAANNRVGIGTTSGARQLTVSNSGAALLLLESTGDDNGQLLFGDSADGTVGKVGYAHSTNHMFFNTNGSEQMRIDESGRVTTPSQPSCLIRLFPAVGNATTVTGGSVSHNIGNHYNASNGRFTAPVAGRYFVSFGFLTNSANSRVEMQVRKNNSPVVAGNESTGSSPHGSVSGSCVVTMAVNDYLEVRNVSGTLYGGHDNNFLSVHLVG